jgi:hypothetical protein
MNALLALNWEPQLRGILIIIIAVSVLCGSVYLILGTNLGARLGFLVAVTGLMGFMVILSLLWCTTASPLNTIKGRIPQWRVQEVIQTPKTPDNSSIEAVHGIQKKANRVDPTEAANVKAAVDAVLVPKVDTPTTPLGPEDNKFAIDEFTDVTKYMILNTYEVGGSSPQFWKLEFTHEPLYAVSQFCEVKQPDPNRPTVLPPIPPECNPDGIQGFVVLSRDLGSLRVPPFVAFVMATILFILGLLMLHWREKDEMEAEAKQQERQEAEKRPTPVPAKV